RENNDRFRSDVDSHDGEWGHIRLEKIEQGGAAVKSTFVQPDGGPATDRTVVRLDLPQPVAPGASTTLDIDFLGQLPRVVARTGYYGSFHLVGQWFPKINRKSTRLNSSHVKISYAVFFLKKKSSTRG